MEIPKCTPSDCALLAIIGRIILDDKDHSEETIHRISVLLRKSLLSTTFSGWKKTSYRKILIEGNLAKIAFSMPPLEADAIINILQEFSQQLAEQTQLEDLSFLVGTTLLLIGGLAAVTVKIDHRIDRYMVPKNCLIHTGPKIRFDAKNLCIELECSTAYSAQSWLNSQRIANAMQQILSTVALLKRVEELNRHNREQTRAMAATIQKTVSHATELSDLLELRNQLAESRNRELEQDAALARVTQMLAHDVRKPFSILKMILDLFVKASSLEEIRKIAQTGLPEIQQAMTSVNGLISDVMEVSSKATPHREITKPEELIHTSLHEVFRMYPDSDVTVRYQLKHQFHALVDTSKVLRVFSNIIGNAVQALGVKGSLFISTRQVIKDSENFIEFAFGNDGPLIPIEAIPRLFDNFFTSGKKGGTGLGLAIAHKIVLAHGGQISCESSLEIGTIFRVTLPAANLPLLPCTDILPTHSADCRIKLESFGGCSSQEERDLESRLKEHIKIRNGKIRLLLIDDEVTYRNTLASYLNDDREIAIGIEIHQADASGEAMTVIRSKQLDLIIVDVEMGSNSLNGFELVEYIRKSGSKSFVCIHSNRVSSTDQRLAIEAGADAHFIKPMARVHLLKLLLQSIHKIESTDNPSKAPSRTALPQIVFSSLQALPEVAILDDMQSTLACWRLAMKDAKVYTFVTPEEFSAWRIANPLIFANLAVLITDYKFHPKSTLTGLDVAKEINHIRPELPVLLCSNMDFEDDELTSYNVVIIPKAPISYEDLQNSVQKYCVSQIRTSPQLDLQIQ